MNLNICKPAPGQMAIWLAKETALFSAFEQEEAERQRRRTQKIIDDMFEPLLQVFGKSWHRLSVGKTGESDNTDVLMENAD